MTHFLPAVSSPSTTSTQEEADMEVEEEGGKEGSPPCTVAYEPRKALEMAIMDWLPELYKPKSSFGQKNIFYTDLVSKKSDPKLEVEKINHDIELEDKSDGKKIDEDVPMATDEENRNKKPDDTSQNAATDGRKKYLENNLYWEEVQMICDFFYLPFEHGPTGEKMLNAAKWLVDHFHLVFHPFPDSLQQRFTSGGYYQSPNTNTSFSTTQQATLPLTNTTATILGASGKGFSAFYNVSWMNHTTYSAHLPRFRGALNVYVYTKISHLYLF